MADENFKILKINDNNKKYAKQNKVEKNLNSLSVEEEKFCKDFIKNGIALNSFLKVFPKEKNFSENIIKCHLYSLLKKKRIVNRLNELKTLKDSAIARTISLDKRKLLEKAITMLEECDNKAERGHAVNILKMLFQKEGLLNEQKNINVQINNNTIVNDVSNFLDL